MKAFLTQLFILLYSLILASCATPYQNSPFTSYSGPSASYNKPVWDISSTQVQIESDPPGARIEFDDGYLGVTPCTISVPSVYDRQFTFQLQPHVLRALPTTDTLRTIPTTEKQYTQVKLFQGGQPIPQKVFFDMNLAPVPQTLDINVSQ